MLLDAQLLAIVNDQVRRAITRPLRMATVVERTSDIEALVVEDAGVVSMRALVFGDLLVYEGDRVMIAQVGSEWVVVGGLTPRWPAELHYMYISAGETTTSSSFVDAPGIPSDVADRTFIKRSNLSAVEAFCCATCYINGAVPTRVQWAAKFTDLNTGLVYGPLHMADHNFATAGQRHAQTGMRIFTGANQMPAGEYDAVMMWARVPAGTGTITTSTSEDRWEFRAREIHPQV